MNISDLVPIKGDLYNRKTDTSIGTMFRDRILYNKPDTDLYFLQIHDDKYTISGKQLNSTTFTPQMTFKCHITNAVSIMLGILGNESINKRIKRQRDILMEYEIIAMVQRVVNELIDNYNANTDEEDKKIEEDEYGARLKGFLFLMFYKILMYMKYYNPNSSSYFKDLFSFLPRHTNYEIYEKIMEILNERFEEDASHFIFNMIVLNSLVLKKYVPSSDCLEKIIDDEDDPDYGNPSVSFFSYFDFFTTQQHDWFIKNNIDVYSSTYTLDEDDNVLLENRFFNIEFCSYAQKKCGFKIKEDNPISFRQMYKLYECMYTKNLIFNKRTHSLLKKTFGRPRRTAKNRRSSTRSSTTRRSSTRSSSTRSSTRSKSSSRSNRSSSRSLIKTPSSSRSLIKTPSLEPSIKTPSLEPSIKTPSSSRSLADSIKTPSFHTYTSSIKTPSYRPAIRP
jgi:hypothetical protein